LRQVLGGRRVQDDTADGPKDREVLLVVQLAELGRRVELPLVGHAVSVIAGVDAGMALAMGE